MCKTAVYLTEAMQVYYASSPAVDTMNIFLKASPDKFG